MTFTDWWVWNQLPVTAGNLLGGLSFTGLALYYAYRRTEHKAAVEAPSPVVAYDTQS